MRQITPFLALFLVSAWPAQAHVSERALVLILPTDFYTRFGVAAVVLTVLLTVLVPAAAFRRVLEFGRRAEAGAAPGRARNLVSLLSSLVFLALLVAGALGTRDPLENLLVLVVFTLWWICLPVAQAVFGDVWGWLSPWRGLVALLFGSRRLVSLPERWGSWPAVLTYLLAGLYTLTDIAPDDPDRLAWVAGGYWLATLALCGVFGRDWLDRGEGFTLFFNLLARLTPLRWRPVGLQFPGKAVTDMAPSGASVAVFVISALAIGSFDGLNETFWWMAQIGINPLEFPGRSAVIWPNRIGLLAAILALNLIFLGCVWLGLRLIRQAGALPVLYGKLALTLLPIALGYHFAHYLTSALVGLQYVVLALNDPLASGQALLGLDDTFVTTSFFNQRHTVETIWLTQAASIVIAHMLAVILSHAIALKAFGRHWQAVLSQLPVSGFMVAYTFFGLWLLASPVAL